MLAASCEDYDCAYAYANAPVGTGWTLGIGQFLRIAAVTKRNSNLRII